MAAATRPTPPFTEEHEALRESIRRVDGGYLVGGSKTFITNGVRADFVVTAVRTTEEGGHQGLSFLLIEKGMEGFSVSRATCGSTRSSARCAIRGSVRSGAAPTR